MNKSYDFLDSLGQNWRNWITANSSVKISKCKCCKSINLFMFSRRKVTQSKLPHFHFVIKMLLNQAFSFCLSHFFLHVLSKTLNNVIFCSPFCLQGIWVQYRYWKPNVSSSACGLAHKAKDKERIIFKLIGKSRNLVV